MVYIIALVKQVPNLEEVKFDQEKGRIDRSSARGEINPFDLNALEEAVRFKEEIGGKITALSMGPPQAESSLRDSLARGCDNAILITGKEFAGADTWATSYTLATAIKKLGKFDLIVSGEKTIDGDTGQVGPEVAELLEIPHIAYVHKVLERNPQWIKVEADLWGASYQKKLSFPGLITVSKDANTPRVPKFKEKLEARKATIKRWGIDKFEIPAKKFGLKGSHTKVSKITIPKEKERKRKLIKEKPSKVAEEICKKIKEWI